MEITVNAQGNVNIVTLEGKFDIPASEQFDEKLIPLISDGAHRIILDFSGVLFVASSGLRVILKTAQRVKDEKGLLHICGVNETVMEVFQMTGFDTILSIFKTKEDAMDGME